VEIGDVVYFSGEKGLYDFLYGCMVMMALRRLLLLRQGFLGMDYDCMEEEEGQEMI